MAHHLMRIGCIAAAYISIVFLAAIAVAQTSDTGADKKSTASLDQLIQALEDPDQRDAIIDRLKGAVADKDTETSAPGDSVVDEALDSLRAQQAMLGSFVVDLAGTFNQLPDLASWMTMELQQAEKRAVWLEVATRLLIVLLVGYALRILVRSAAARLVDRTWHAHPGYILTRDLAGIIALGIGATLTLLLIHPSPQVFDAGTKVIIGAVASRGAIVIIAALLAPDRRFDHLLPMQEKTAKLLYGGLAVALRIGILGHFLLAAAQELGLPDNLVSFIENILYLAVTVTLIVTVIRTREPAARAVMAWSEASDGLVKRLVPWSFLGAYGHWLAIGWIATHYIVWSLNLPGGTIILSRATIGTILLLAAGRLLLIGVDRMLHWGATTPVEDDELVAEVQERATRYVRPLRLVLRTVVLLVSVLLLAQIWSLGILDWFATSTGSAVLSTVLRILAIVIVAVVLSEVAASSATRYIEAKTEADTPLHSNRSRTLTSILRNVVIVAVVLSAAMMTLSELGVNAAALLAGAGVIGLAIGFGSQRLVQDLITGLFILLGDSIRVGDIVTVASLSGVVESMSMRTVTLRGYDGNVHTVPYSSIDTVTNMTKDFSFAVLNVRVDYQEDVDQVMQMLRDIDSELRREWPYRRQILAPLDIAGVDALDDSAVVIRCRSKVRPGEQWGIRREFNRRIKAKYDELGMKIPFPHQTVFFGADKSGKAPPMFIEQRSTGLKAEDSAAAPARSQDTETG